MNRYPLPLRVQLPMYGERAKLLESFVYRDRDQESIQVPAGFETDFASVKPVRDIAVVLLGLSLLVGWFFPVAGAALGTAGFYALLLFASVVGYGNAAATIHDWLYSTGILSRAAADRVFFNALRSSRVALWRAWLMYAGVRLGGYWRYKRR